MMKRKILVSLFLLLAACNQQHKLEVPFPKGADAPLLDVTDAQPTPEPTAVPINPPLSRPIIPPAKPQPLIQAPVIETKTVPPQPLPLTPSVPVKPPAPVKPNPLLAKKWVHKGGALTKLEFLGLLKFGEGDPAVQSVIADGLKVINSSDPADLGKWVHVCPKLEFQGEYVYNPTYSMEPITNEELKDAALKAKHLEGFKAELEKNGGEIIFLRDNKDYLDSIHLVKREKICLPTAEKSVEEVYLSLVHELVHFSRIKVESDPLNFVDLYADKKSYIESNLTAPGDEIEAFTVMFQAQIRLDQGTPGLPKEVKGSFNEQGDLINKDKLRAALKLWGYDNMKGDEYDDRLERDQDDIIELNENLGRLEASRFGDHNPAVHDSLYRLDKTTNDLHDLVLRIQDCMGKKE